MAVSLQTEEAQVERRVSPMPLPIAEEAVETTILPSAALLTQNDSAASSPRRYDQATIERALALAAAMQEEHRATLTAEQVVRLGEEMNVDPAFVLKALSRLNAEEQAVAEARNRVIVPQPVATGFRKVPRTDVLAAAVLPCAFSLLAYTVFRELMFDNWYSSLVLFVAAPLFTIFLGVRLRSKRLGFASGALLGLLLTVAVLLTTPNPPNVDIVLTILWLTLVWTLPGAALGGLAAIIALHGAQMYRRSAAALARYFPDLAGTDA